MKNDCQKFLLFFQSILFACVFVPHVFAQVPPVQPNTGVAQPGAPAVGSAQIPGATAVTAPNSAAVRPATPPQPVPVVSGTTAPPQPTSPAAAPAQPGAATPPVGPATTGVAQPGTTPQTMAAPQNSATGTVVSEVITVTTTTQNDGKQAKSVYLKPFRKLFALVKTDLGSFRMSLQANQKPITVENFVRLAEGSKASKDLKSGRISFAPFYDGLTFHRALRGTLIQTGCPYGDGRGGPGHTIQDESNEFDTVEEGSVLMARASSKAKNSAGSQFYIMLRPLPDLTDQDTIFGKVIEGLDVVRKISEVKVDRTDRPVNPVKIISITIQKE